MGTVDIPISSLVFAFLLLGLPIAYSLIFGFRLIRPLLNSVFRMTVQLILIGIFLKYLFEWNNPWINLAWLMLMIMVAVVSVLRNSSIKVSKVLLPTLISFTAATFFVIFYLNIVVIRLDYLFDARYLIVLGGMLLGNSLRGNIVGVSTFYQRIASDSDHYHFLLSAGATQHEALLPYFQSSVELALKPTLASMTTMGIVALPGMMTGVILGGASPEVAIKYQIMIMIAIVVSTASSVVLTLLMTWRVGFTRYGLLRKDILFQEPGAQSK